jgi:hypothetical protein
MAMPALPSVFGPLHPAHATTTDCFGMCSRVGFVQPYEFLSEADYS